MGTYAPPSTGVNISDFVSNIGASFDAVRSMERGSTVPPNVVRGQLWDCTDSTTLTALGAAALGEALVWRNGSDAWVLFADPDYACINRGGTIAFAANQPMGGFKLTGLAAGTSNGDSVRYEQVVLLAGSTMTGTLGFSGSGKIVNGSQVIDANSQKITNLAAPSSANDAARKADVDAAAPAVGTVSVSTGGSTDIALGFNPSRVKLKWMRSGQNSTLGVWESGSTGVAETERVLSVVSGTTYSDAIDVTRQSGTPVLGFTVTIPGTLGGTSGGSPSIWYEAWR